jgi:Cellulase (glycosyl hydrolase family 5)
VPIILHAGGTRVYSTAQYQSMLHVGMDVDWLKTSSGRDAALAARAAGVNVPALFYARGLRHVRLRVAEYDLASSRPNTPEDTILDEIEAAVYECLAAGLIPIVAFQADRFKSDPTSDAELEAVLDWWAAVATRLAGWCPRLAFNIVIEATDALKQHSDRLNLLYEKAEQRLHGIDPNRIVIIAPNKISDPHELAALVVPPSPLVMVEWHFYVAGPQKDNLKKQWTTGTQYEKGLILERVQTAANWSDAHAMPTWVGAWMANNYNSGDSAGTTGVCELGHQVLRQAGKRLVRRHGARAGRNAADILTLPNRGRRRRRRRRRCRQRRSGLALGFAMACGRACAGAQGQGFGGVAFCVKMHCSASARTRPAC